MRPVQNDQVWVSVGYTVNLGNYESAKVEMGTCYVLGEHDDAEEQRKLLYTKLRNEVIERGELFAKDVERHIRKQIRKP